MTNKDILLKMIENLNEEGSSTLVYLFGDMDKNERYNVSTTPERLAELQQIREQKDELEKEQHGADLEKESYERARAEYDRRKAFKAALIGKEKRLFDLVNGVTDCGRYCMEYWEMILFADAYNNNLLNGSYDIFRYGFLKGQRAEKNRRKRGKK